ncbi:MAG: DinB family protein [Gemmatimonadales bacterium]
MGILTDLVRGKRVHVDPVAALDGLPWELAGARVAHHPHTIWQLLGHLNYWIDYGLRLIETGGITPPKHAAESWPQADGPADDAAWQHEVALFRTNLGQLSALADARASTLNRMVDKETGKTVEAVLWELVVHNSHHLGQIVQLRQALKAWPPPGGGMTW